MAIVYFGKTVKYKGNTYLPNTKFEVADNDVNDLKLQGAWVVNEEVSSVKEEIIKEEVKEEINETDILKEKASELGIDFKGNWGIRKLTSEIRKAEQVQ